MCVGIADAKAPTHSHVRPAHARCQRAPLPCARWLEEGPKCSARSRRVVVTGAAAEMRWRSRRRSGHALFDRSCISPARVGQRCSRPAASLLSAAMLVRYRWPAGALRWDLRPAASAMTTFQVVLQERESNPRHSNDELPALPLSYVAWRLRRRSVQAHARSNAAACRRGFVNHGRKTRTTPSTSVSITAGRAVMIRVFSVGHDAVYSRAEPRLRPVSAGVQA